MKNLGYYNGRIEEFETMMIPMSDRVCFFGDGVYDATYSRNYKIFSLGEHVDRFYNSARLLRIEIPQTKEEMMTLLKELILKMDTGGNFVYWQITRGAGQRNHAFPDDGSKGNLWVNIFPKNIVDLSKRIKMITMEDTRFLHCNIKTLNLIPSVMAAQRAKEMGCFEAVFHRGGRVTECSHSNVHIIKNGVFMTAPADNLILPGITRAQLIKICAQMGIPVSESPFSICDMMDADEIMVSSCSALCLGVEEIDGQKVGGKALALIQQLQNAMLEKFMGETSK